MSDKEKKYPKTYYSAFIFKGHPDPEEIHCTHKFFGELTSDQAEKVEKLIDDYFSEPRSFPRAIFSKEEMYGAEKNVRVLCPEKIDPEDWFPDLREQFDEYRKDDFDYSPHVTTSDLECLDEPFESYALMYDEEVIRTWPNEELRSEVDEMAVPFPYPESEELQEDSWDSELLDDVMQLI